MVLKVKGTCLMAPPSLEFRDAETTILMKFAFLEEVGESGKEGSLLIKFACLEGAGECTFCSYNFSKKSRKSATRGG